jgi:hypothetical protein
MNYPTFSYSAKVWLCSVFAAPAIYFIGAYFHQPIKTDPLSSFAEPYVVISFFEMLCSAITWLVFWFLVGLIVWIIEQNALRKFLLSVTGMALTLATFRVFSSFMLFPLSGNSLILMLINCGCIGIACWCFRPEPKIDPLTRVNPYLYETETKK